MAIQRIASQQQLTPAQWGQVVIIAGMQRSQTLRFDPQHTEPLLTCSLVPALPPCPCTNLIKCDIRHWNRARMVSTGPLREGGPSVQPLPPITFGALMGGCSIPDGLSEARKSACDMLYALLGGVSRLSLSSHW
jgi:hypothetical protein